MGINVFLGKPPSHIEKWIKDHYGPTAPKHTIITYTDGTTTAEVEVGTDGILTQTLVRDAGDYTAIQSVEIGKDVSSIGDYAFSDCRGLTSITIPSSVTEIGDNAFEYCSGLTEILIKSTTITIGTNAFLNCETLTSLTFENIDTETIVAALEPWGLGLIDHVLVNSVVIYCSDGIIVINGSDDSSNDTAAHVDFDIFSAALENSNGDTSTLPAVGALLNVPYKIDHTADAVDTQWQIMGYNASIPEYVKYKSDSGEYAFVRSVGEDTSLLRDIVAGCKIYSKTDDTYTDTGKTVSACGTETFTYGNNCTYSVPTTITVDGTTYTFCGYNVTLNMRHVLGVKSGDAVYYYSQFDTSDSSYNYGRNDWSTSQVRYWLNDTETNDSGWTWSGSNWSGSITYSSSTALQTRFPSRVTDTAFNSHVVPTVNRTWVYNNF